MNGRSWDGIGELKLKRAGAVGGEVGVIETKIC